MFRHAGRIVDRCPSYTVCSTVATAGDFSRRREGMEGRKDGRGKTHAPAPSAFLELYMTREVVHMASLDLDESHRVVAQTDINIIITDRNRVMVQVPQPISRQRQAPPWSTHSTCARQPSAKPANFFHHARKSYRRNTRSKVQGTAMADASISEVLAMQRSDASTPR